jgi:hypothetical protein
MVIDNMGAQMQTPDRGCRRRDRASRCAAGPRREPKVASESTSFASALRCSAVPVQIGVPLPARQRATAIYASLVDDPRPLGAQVLQIADDPFAERPRGTKAPVHWISAGAAPPDNVVRTVSNWEHFDGALVAVGVTDNTTITIWGSGVMVAPGLVLTAKHVVDNFADAVESRELDYCCIAPRLSGRADFWRGDSLRYAENESDTAFLGVKLNSPIGQDWAVSCFPISVIPPRPDEMLTVVGFRFKDPDSIMPEQLGGVKVVAQGDMHASAGRVAAFHPYASSSFLPYPAIEISSGVVGGMSGGAVLDRNGAIVGLVSRGFTADDGLGPTYSAWILQALMFKVVLRWPNGVYVPDTAILNLPKDCIKIVGRRRVQLSSGRREITYRRCRWLPSRLERLAMRALGQQPPR